MSIDDELNQHLSALSQSDLKPARQERDGERLVREIREVCVDIARVLWDRRIPAAPITVRSEKPASRLTHFFKGDDSNPLVRVADGWEIIACFMVDTSGKIWQAARGKGEWEPADIAWWEHEFSRTDMQTDPFVYLAGNNYLTKYIDDDGEPWLEMKRMVNFGGDLRPEALPVRDMLLKATAELIAEHSSV